MKTEDTRMEWTMQFSGMDERKKKLIRTMYGKQNIWDMLDGDNIEMPDAMYKVALSFLKSNGYEKTCKRCGGSGKYHHVTRYGDRCFDCEGEGKYIALPTQRELDRLARRFPNGLINNRESDSLD
ncbi:hypothetical protein [Staphylococcus aureus]|uniref:hypothetical protein n=1 Tax=Staphylococcus aureus TaxID=1280 RepID=UPI0020BFFB70|nr:hypothetical protein [Staphylococcus aureus]